MTNTITIQNRIATVSAADTLVGGNTYPVTFALDSEWSGTVYVRVRFGAYYYDIPGTVADGAVTANVQMPVGYPEVALGVFSEALQICTNEVRFKLLRGIVETGSEVVEFDSDLYDQWAGEVTELLTDDAFDAESTRPVQNAVLTAWKNTVALDADVVHKTGTETIAGAKTLTSGAKIEQSGTDMLTLGSTQASTAAAIKSDIIYSDMVDGVQTPAIRIRHRSYANHGDLWFLVSDPARSRTAQFRMNAYADHGELMTDAPYYPVDGDGNPQPLAYGQYVASGNIAIDPRLVHTTGTETIAGAKTFSSAVTSEGGFHWGYNSLQVALSAWIRIYTFEPPSTSTALRVLIQTIRAEAMIQTMNDAIEFYVSTGLNMNGSIRSNSGLEGKLALNSATGKIELWIHRATGSGTMSLYCNFIQTRGYRGAAAESVTGDEPVAGEVYSSVYTLGAVE